MIIAEHSVKLSLLPHKANILDLGCRGFEFAHHPKIARHNVVCVDIGEFEGDYYRIAISDKDGRCGVFKHEDPQATHIIPGDDIPMMTIRTLSMNLGIDYWDLIKMDIEGEELKVLETASHPIAGQISVEFHAHCAGQTKEQIDTLLDKLSKWYFIQNRHWQDRHCAGFNYWDVLLINRG